MSTREEIQSHIDSLQKQFDTVMAELRRQLDAHEKQPSLDELQRRFRDAGYHDDGEAWEYVRALEKCRPWVVLLADGSMVVDDIGPCIAVPLLFDSRAMAQLYASRIHGDCGIVQWEGQE